MQSEHLVVILRNAYSKCNSLWYEKKPNCHKKTCRQKTKSHEWQQGCENHIQNPEILNLH